MPAAARLPANSLAGRQCGAWQRDPAPANLRPLRYLTPGVAATARGHVRAEPVECPVRVLVF